MKGFTFIFVLLALGKLGFCDDRFPEKEERVVRQLENLNSKIDLLNEQIYTLNATNVEMRKLLEVLVEAVMDTRNDIEWEINPHAEFSSR